ncbi:MAG: sigma-70 family RNA polymerase sigma factor [Defluviitaleaceae bacterium]|nr:sigma-70 family RNA polymerase sigma factor [Defluviitaleaceae bacterium]
MLYIYMSILETESEKLTFAKMYEETRHTCLSVAVSITNNQALAEDAVHDAFVSAIKYKEKFFSMPCGKRKSLIVIITKNKAIDLMRKKDNRNYSGENYEEIADNYDLYDILENQESYAYLINCIGSLPEKYRVAFDLRYVEGMSNLEIASLLGITNKAVSTQLARAKIMLREMIDKDVSNGCSIPK